jgi:outer membrane protein assembly factor BamA
MSRIFRACFGSFLLQALLAILPASAQSPGAAGAPLREVHAEGAKALTEAQIVSLAGLQPGSQVGKDDLQAAADRLIESGLFAKVKFNFLTRGGGVLVTYHVEESPRLPVYFDNMPWFADSELADAIRKTFPYFDGTLPEAGAAVDRASDAVKELLSSRGLQAAVEHAVIPNPAGDGNVQEFRIEGGAPQIATIEFSDRSVLASKVVQQHLSEIRGKAYSRLAIDLFLTEAIRPCYFQQG